MELRDIEYFVVLAEHGHFGRAAAALGISQPALSKSLRRLEAVLEVSLMRRTAKRVELTAEGSALASRARELRLSLQSVTQEIKEIDKGRVGQLRIGVGAAISENFLAAAFGELRKEAPRITLSVIVSDNDLLVPALRTGELDLIVNYNYTLNVRTEGVFYEHLYHDDFVVCAAAGHRLSKRRHVELCDLVNEHWALSEPNLMSQQKLRNAFRDAGLPPPRVGLECRSTGLRLRSAAESDLLDFSSRSVIRELARADVKILPIRELSWRRSVGLLLRKQAYVPRALQRLIDILKSTSKDGGPST
jgi:DNA-binding transcriptional LysR family regulator